MQSVTKTIVWILLLTIFSCTEKVQKPKHSHKKKYNPFYEKAFILMDKNQSDSAFYFLNKAKDLFHRQKDNFGVGKSYVNMAVLQENTGDNFGSIESSLTAFRFLKQKDTSHYQTLFSNYNNLGVASNNLKNYDDAKRFYNKAFLFTKDPIDRMSLQNNLAIVYHNKKDYRNAVKIYDRLLDSIGSRSEFYPRLLLNFSRSKWFENRSYNPVHNYLLAEKLSEKLEDDWTKDAAFAYLSAYYLDKNADSSRLYSTKMLSLAKKLNYPADQLEALQNLIKLSDGKQSQKYFDDYSRIQDSLVNAQNKAKNQFALIRFESEKSKSENLILQKEHTAHKYQVQIQNMIIGLLLFCFILIVILAYFWLKKRREKLHWETNNKLQEQRLDFSKKVHDVVANGIYEVMTTIENQDNLPKERILDKLELMYEKSRNLSYENELQQDFYERISGLISSFDNEKTKIIIIGNDEVFWSTHNQLIQEELFQIMRELLVNMKKHSHASQVIVRFITTNNASEIRYIDNGIGVDENFVEKNGFKNMKTRLKEMNATLEMEESVSGLKLSIKI